MVAGSRPIPAAHRRRCRWLVLLLVLLVGAGTEGRSSFPRTVYDGTGAVLYIAQPPQRIFSTVLAIDNIVLELVDPQRVVGVTRYAADPRWSYVVDRVGDHMALIDRLEPERVVAARPDIVFVADWSDQDAVRQLKSLGLTVYTFTGFTGVEDGLDNLLRVGQVTGEEDLAERLVADFRERLRRVTSRVSGLPRPRVVSLNAWGTVEGRRTSAHDVIELAGGRNAAAERGIVGWAEIDVEGLIAMSPDVIITNSGSDFVNAVLNDPLLSNVPAVAQGRVYHIDHMEALSHRVIDAIEQLARRLHPEAFLS